MAYEHRNTENDKIALEIGRKLASEGRYNDAYKLLHPLIHSQYAIEVSNIIAKMYAQNRDFISAEKYFINTLNMDSHNSEALLGLKKCRELKNSKFREFLSFNKLNILFIVFIIVVACLLAVVFNAIF